MSFLGKLVSLFPLGHFLAILAAGSYFLLEFNLLAGVLLVLAIYGLPLVFFWGHRLIFPTKNGFYPLDQKVYCPWWGDHQFQKLFNLFPALERVLSLIPKAYPFWLRLWGAKIGRGVYFTGRIEILDRPGLIIGDGVILGYEVAITSHCISKMNKKLVLYYNPPQLGKGAFIGACAKIPPGAVIASGAKVPFGFELMMNQHLSEQSPVADKKRALPFPDLPWFKPVKPVSL